MMSLCAEADTKWQEMQILLEQTCQWHQCGRGNDNTDSSAADVYFWGETTVLLLVQPWVQLATFTGTHTSAGKRLQCGGARNNVASI